MASHFKVSDILTPADRERFHALVDDPRQTIKTLHAWMTRRGYRISHGAVGNYLRNIRRGTMAELSRSLAGMSDAAARTRIKNILPRLRGSELTYLAGMAEFVLIASGTATSIQQRPHGGELEHHGRRSARLPGRAVAA